MLYRQLFGWTEESHENPYQNSKYVFRASLQERNCEYKPDALPLGVCIAVYADIQGVPRRGDRISEACFKDHTKQNFLINYSDCILTYIPVYFTSLRMNRNASEIV